MRITPEEFVGIWDTTYLCLDDQNEVDLIEETLQIRMPDPSEPAKLIGRIQHMNGMSTEMIGTVSDNNVWSGMCLGGDHSKAKFALMVNKASLVGSYRIGLEDEKLATTLAGTRKENEFGLPVVHNIAA